MSPDLVVLVGAGVILAVSVVSGKLERALLTEPLVAATLGVIVGAFLAEPVDLEAPTVLTVLELTLALVLFTDASRIDVARLREGYSWPLRMLVIGIPAAVVLGAAVSGWYLSLPLGLALLVGVILAPTDAALAAPVLRAESVPPRVRQTLNIEAGMNDGLAVPLLLIAIGLIETEGNGSLGASLGLVLSQLGIGIVGGIVVGWIGAFAIDKGVRGGWMSPLQQKIAAVALALAGFAGVQILGGSGFVATFIAGGLMSYLVGHRCEYLYQFAEAEGDTLVLVAFFIFGAGPGIALVNRGVSLEGVVIAAISLFVVRPLAVWLSLVGQGLHGRTVVFLGWFGPRGLATIVFLLVSVEELGAIPPLIRETITFTVLASIVLHGVSAVPMARWLAVTMGDMPEDMPEMGEAFPHPMPGVR